MNSAGSSAGVPPLWPLGMYVHSPTRSFSVVSQAAQVGIHLPGDGEGQLLNGADQCQYGTVPLVTLKCRTAVLVR
jgi:hypothetical protein